MRFLRYVILASACLLCGCSQAPELVGQLESELKIFPDYKEVTVPSNIAPLNFEVLEEGDFRLIVSAEGKTSVLNADDGLFTFGRRSWKSLLTENKGKSISLQVCRREDDGWQAYEPFHIHVAEEEIDPYIAYRLIPPGYTMWSEMGIYQRNLENYTQSLIYSNLQGKGNCVNCHSFPDRDPENMLFHLRSELGGTYLMQEGSIEKLNTKTDQTMSALVYPYWHPSAEMVAFTVNVTNEVVHTINPNRVEVFDEASDVVVYDINNHEIITTDLLSSADAYETFPTFSPDGRSLYFCSAVAVEEMPRDFRDVKYSLCRVDFDPQTKTFGTKADTLYNALEGNRSVSFPRVSPDGKHLVFVLSDYGNFSLWHKEADLYCVDLQTGEISSMDALNSNDAESYHSWSGNSRWLVFSSRRDDGLYTKPYIAYIAEDGTARKPFLLPQKDPKAYYDEQMYAYNIPEFVSGKVKIKGSDVAAFARKDKGIQVGFIKK